MKPREPFPKSRRRRSFPSDLNIDLQVVEYIMDIDSAGINSFATVEILNFICGNVVAVIFLA